jgi:hypothetical protein
MIINVSNLYAIHRMYVPDSKKLHKANRTQGKSMIYILLL